MTNPTTPVSIQQLREIAFPQAKRGIEPAASLWTYRYASVFLTWVLIRTPASPNQITTFGIVISLAGCVLLAHSNSWVGLLGCFLLHLGYLLDCCDGEVARYKSLSSQGGTYLDKSFHALVLPMLFLCSGVYYCYQMDAYGYIVLGAVAGYSAHGIAQRLALDMVLPLIEAGFAIETVKARLSQSKTGNVRWLSPIIRHFFRHATFAYLITFIWIANLWRPSNGLVLWQIVASLLIMNDLSCAIRFWESLREFSVLGKIESHANDSDQERGPR